MWQTLVFIAIGGALGTLARFGLSGLTQRLCARTYLAELPVGTLVVNLVGCFVFGLLWSLADERLLISGQTRFRLLTGFVGAFTTFSSFAFETDQLLRDSQWLWALGNLAAHNGLGLLCIVLGLAAGRLL